MFDRCFFEKYIPFIRDEETHNRLEEYALPAPALTDDDNGLALIDIKVQSLEDLIVTKRKPHFPNTDQWNTSLAMK